MKPVVSVVDYGVGNLLSVARALERCGASVEFVQTPEQVSHSRMLLLPGVGAFADGMKELNVRQLVLPIVEFAKSGRPLLGICLGMQMLLTASEEFGEHRGLGVVPGRVIAIPPTRTDGRPHKIPHIGWNALQQPRESAWDNTILAGIEPGTDVYFVHTYTAMPASSGNRLADCDYDGCLVSAAVRQDQIYGCQFHPEKSGPVGLKVLENFLKLY